MDLSVQLLGEQTQLKTALVGIIGQYREMVQRVEVRLFLLSSTVQLPPDSQPSLAQNGDKSGATINKTKSLPFRSSETTLKLALYKILPRDLDFPTHF
jgi:hypothetical protein